MSRSCADVPVFPEELVVEILSRVPVKDLMRWRCVSKSWNSLISDPTLVKLHLERSPRDTPILFTIYFLKTEPCFLHCSSIERLLKDPSSAINVDDGGVPAKMKYDIIGDCNGLVCLRAMDRKSEVIWVRFWNPATRLRSKKSSCTQTWFGYVKMGFGYDDSNDTYKVVAVVRKDKKSAQMELRVHSLGDNSWRNIASGTDFPTDFLQDRGQFLNGTINWAAQHDIGTSKSYVVFSFDIKNDTYRHFSLPVNFWFGLPEIGVFGGCLVFSHRCKKTHLAVWQMKEFGDEKSWTRLLHINLEFLDFHCRGFPHPLCLSADNDVLLLVNNTDCQLIRCDWRDYTIEHIKMLRRSVLLNSTNYVQSLVSPYRN